MRSKSILGYLNTLVWCWKHRLKIHSLICQPKPFFQLKPRASSLVFFNQPFSYFFRSYNTSCILGAELWFSAKLLLQCCHQSFCQMSWYQFRKASSSRKSTNYGKLPTYICFKREHKLLWDWNETQVNKYCWNGCNLRPKKCLRSAAIVFTKPQWCAIEIIQQAFRKMFGLF